MENDVPWHSSPVEEVVPGLYRVPLPLPHTNLAAVNIYAICRDDRVTLIDAGWDDHSTGEALMAALSTVDISRADIADIVVTHYHRDHVGQASALRAATGARFALGAGERPFFTMSMTDSQQFPSGHRQTLLLAGANELAQRLDQIIPPVDFDWADPDVWLNDTDYRTATANLVCLPTPGHTTGHLCYLDEERRVLFAGDHILPQITPSIGFEHRLRETALSDYLTSLASVRDLDVDLVLPAHGPVFTGLAARVDELLHHHDVRFSAILDALRAHGGTSAFEVAQLVRWTRREVSYEDLKEFDRLLAVRETLAHLHVLEAQGRVVQALDEGVLRFTL